MSVPPLNVPAALSLPYPDGIQINRSKEPEPYARTHPNLLNIHILERARRNNGDERHLPATGGPGGRDGPR